MLFLFLCTFYIFFLLLFCGTDCVRYVVTGSKQRQKKSMFIIEFENIYLEKEHTTLRGKKQTMRNAQTANMKLETKTILDFLKKK